MAVLSGRPGRRSEHDMKTIVLFILVAGGITATGAVVAQDSSYRAEISAATGSTRAAAN